MNARMQSCVEVVLLAFSAVFAPAAVAEATAIPLGFYTIIANNSFGNLEITAIDPAGIMTLSVLGSQAIGFYNSTTNSILFLRQAGAALDTIQQFFGELLVRPGSPGSCTFAFTGTFTAYAGTVGTAARHNFAWVAFRDGPC